jgi:hypothetical protein
VKTLNLKFALTPRTNGSAMSQVEAYLMAHPNGSRLGDMVEALEPLTIKQVQVALRNLAKVGRAHSDGRHLALHFAGPAKLQSTASANRISRMSRPDYLPERWSNEVARPGGEDHKQYGSLQADGTVKPYHTPIHGCVGRLKDSTSNGRDE